MKLPEGKMLIPGVVTHHTNVRRAPGAGRRAARPATPSVVGRENVIAGTDCGFAQGAFVRRVHPEIQWAKLASWPRARSSPRASSGAPRAAA